ncbi:hypothetical protein CP970_27130 [Streptomyces kanamyceticus]|uniref:Transposase n=1 Tax=Streptomyces kanamyceticus TaxID=1967 RepID=A0A5J6GJU1_STRKN|nr:hypothetical protein [Streptomyces kanamyceticus]QEU94088.1 hypothetical protein CP970_27130 [Streptomyces kanamyceticus]
MHADIHLALHHVRAAELHRTAPTRRPAPRFRDQLGWTLVELGLRLVSSSGPSRPSQGPATRQPCPTA